MISTDITREIATLLAGCTAANGYTSNVGASVLLGRIRGSAPEAHSDYPTPKRDL
jgi:hypothetical protein